MIYSPEKYYFITNLINVSKERTQLAEFKFLEQRVVETEVNYKTIADYAYDWETWEDESGILKYISPVCIHNC